MRRLWLHALLFAAACATTWWHGGPGFAAALMGILVCHEFGHYIVGRRHGVDVSLPYFIPLPPQISLGTLGAVIKMNSPITDRRKLFDVGAAGPVAGLVIAIPVLVLGLHLSEIAPMKPTDMLEGNSILYAVLKRLTFGRWLPGDGVDVQLHPVALAGWVGLLVTQINLMPIGQLDGGHIARAALGDRHEVLSRRLHIALPIVGLACSGVMFAIAMSAGKDWLASLDYAKSGAIPWLAWTLLLWLMRRSAGGAYHPEVDDTPLDPARRRRAIAMLVVFLLIATPVPWRPVL